MTITTTPVAGWAVGTVPADPFSALPDNGEDVDLMAAPPAPRETTDRKPDRDYPAVDPDTVGFDDDPNCVCIDGRCSCASDSIDYRD